MYNLTVSNVPGPRIPLYAAGARVLSIYPIIPIPDQHALSIGMLSYGDHLHVSAYADPEALPGLSPLSILLEDSLAELEIVTAAPALSSAAPNGSARRAVTTGNERRPGMHLVTSSE
jgi:hypothetical protein